MDALSEKINECAEAMRCPVEALQYGKSGFDSIKKLEMAIGVMKLFDSGDTKKMDELDKILKVKQ